MSRNQNDTISERRLRPIYDWLDNGNNKKALQEAEKVLKKQPNFQCCRALKSLALLRLGKEDEAMKILDGILTECPVDEGALNAMTLSYRELKMPEKICTLYENATKQEPENEEFLSHLFMSYVRLGNLKKQQSTAMNLYKVKMKKPYYFWSVMSIVLQAVEGDEKLGQAVTLPLAQKMVEKMEKEGKMEQEQETIIYLLILELRKNWKGALELLNGPLGKKLENSASYHLICLTKRIEIEGKLENWSEVARLSRNVLLQQPDSWDMFNNYIQAVLKLQEADSSNGGEAKEDGPYSMMLNRVDRSVEEAESLMSCLSAGFPGLRGPSLAKLEICYRTLEGRTTRLQDLIIEYIDLFGGKPVCFSDIKKYLKVIPVDQRNDFILRLRSRYPDQVPVNTANIYREICVTGVERYLGQHINLSTEKVDTMVSGLYQRYLATQPLVNHIVSTELRPSDGYLVLAGQLLWERWINTKEKRFFLQACSMLRLGLLSSPSNWQLMLLLIRFLGRVGAGSLCEEVHAPLDVKNLMLDTLGWVLTRVLASSGQAHKLVMMYNQMIRFYLHSPKETTEHIIQAYKHGNLSQICDISKLKRRLVTSHYVPMVNTNKFLINVNFLSSTLEEVLDHAEFSSLTSVDWNSVGDNRDFRTIQCYEPDTQEVSEEMISCNFKLELAFIRARHSTARALVICLKNAAAGEGGKSPSTSEILKELQEIESTLCCLLTECDSLLKTEIFLDLPQAPYKSQLHTFLPSKQVNLVLTFVKLIISAVKSSSDQSVSLSSSDFQPVIQILDDINKDMNNDGKFVDWTGISESLELLNFRIETLSLAVLFTFSLLALLRSGKGMKKGKKAVLAGKLSHLEADYKEITTKSQDMANSLKLRLEELAKMLLDEMLPEQVGGLILEDTEENLINKEKGNLVNKIIDSYRSQSVQMETAIESRLKMLQTLLL